MKIVILCPLANMIFYIQEHCNQELQPEVVNTIVPATSGPGENVPFVGAFPDEAN